MADANGGRRGGDPSTFALDDERCADGRARIVRAGRRPADRDVACAIVHTLRIPLDGAPWQG